MIVSRRVNSIAKSVLTYGAETWSLYEGDRRRINGTEMDTWRRSARISKLDGKTNEYIREKMDAQDTVLDDVTRKQVIWCGHVERMNWTGLAEIVINWKHEGWKKRGRPWRAQKDVILYIQLWVEEIWGQANGTVEGSGMWKGEGVGRRFKTALYIYVYI